MFIVSDHSLKTRTGTEPFSPPCSSCLSDFLWKVRLCGEKYYTWLKCFSSYQRCFSPTVVERGWAFLAVWLPFSYCLDVLAIVSCFLLSLVWLHCWGPCSFPHRSISNFNIGTI